MAGCINYTCTAYQETLITNSCVMTLSENVNFATCVLSKPQAEHNKKSRTHEFTYQQPTGKFNKHKMQVISDFWVIVIEWPHHLEPNPITLMNVRGVNSPKSSVTPTEPPSASVHMGSLCLDWTVFVRLSRFSHGAEQMSDADVRFIPPQPALNGR